MNHRHVTAIAATAIGGLTLLFAGCGEQKRELHIYNWSDYFAEDTIPAFEQEFNCRVIYDKFESNESMYAKLQAGATGYDVVFPSSYFAYIMNQEGMLEPLDRSKLPNISNIDPRFIRKVALDKQMTYSVPFMSGTTGLAIRADRVDEYEASWHIYEREDLKGRMTLLNDPREVLGAALRTLGYSFNTTNPEEVAQAGELVKKWKANIAKFGSDEYKPGIASGEFFVSQGFSGDIMQVVDEAEEGAIVYVLPKEGFSFWADDMTILKDAPDKELAYAFINYLHRPEVAAKNMEFNYYLCPNSAAYELVSDEMKADEMVFLPADVLENGEQIMPLGEKDRIYQEVWSNVRAEE